MITNKKPLNYAYINVSEGKTRQCQHCKFYNSNATGRQVSCQKLKVQVSGLDCCKFFFNYFQKIHGLN